MKWYTIYRRTDDVLSGDVQVGEREFRLDMNDEGKTRVLVLEHRGKHLDDWVWRDAWKSSFDIEAAEIMEEALAEFVKRLSNLLDSGGVRTMGRSPEKEDSFPVEGEKG